MTTYTPPNLQPLTMGQLLDRAIRLYRRNFLTFIGIIAITQIPTLLVGVANAIVTGGFDSLDPFSVPTNNPFSAFSDQIVGLGLLGLFAGLVGIVLTQIANAAVTRAVTDDYFGREISILEAFGRIQNEWLVLLLALILVVLLGIGMVVWWLLVPCVGWLTGGGMLIFLSSVMVPMITPIVVIERQKAGTAVLRAWDLTRRRFWWVLGFALLLSLFGLLVLGGPTLLITMGAAAVVGTSFNSTVALIIQQVAQSVVNVIYLPLPLICFTLLYLDLRVRTEGLDLVIQSANTDEGGDVETALQAAPQPGRWQPTSDEMVKFLAITAALIGLYIGLILIFIAIISIASL